ncbi:MAG TPA: HAD-IC family P-type ATPase [Candidatus Coprovivens excrementavium]|nr:HAD-IC family P-type ATPase [Candidatus Coprovivens excrementavium]
MKFYHSSIDETLSYQKSTKNGLSSIEAQKRLLEYGKNELPHKKKDSIFKLFISQFKNPIELILVVTVILSFLAGEVIDAVALIFIILLDVLMGTYQEWKARTNAESLINMIKKTSIVIRDGREIEINSNEIVPGDIIVLESGDKISADARIIECHNFQVDESPLTGESLNVVKNIEILPEETPLAERKNMIYAGTSVTTGRAHAIVVATALNTEIGYIAEKVTNTVEEKSPLTIRTERFSKQISLLILIIAAITTIILIVKGYPLNDIFLSVIALSVSAMPEGLPLALTMALTIASNRMAKKNVIVKKLNAVESLGSCTVIASDKTGTLTVNEQTAKEILLPNGDTFTISGTGYNDEGEVKPIANANLEDAKFIAFLGAMNNEAHLEKRNQNWESFGDSIDIAFLSLAAKLNIKDLPPIIERIPYESENQYSAVFYQKKESLYCTVKGSLEKVMSFSEENEDIYRQNEELTSKGYRVIALANGRVEGTTISDIKDLQFIGLVAFIDPIRKEVKNSIQECHKAGIKVVMVTGDHPLTAYAIAKDLNLCNSKSEIATGNDVQKYLKLGEKEFDKFVRKVKVFSRVTPIEKLEIVNSYKRQGEFVAVTGDGVNDAPAIKAANIGIAMGSGTDVAKETASMIVTDDNFTSIVSGVKEGRTAYSNIRKITLFLLSCGFAEVCFFLLSITFGYDIPLLAIQLLWLNIVTDGLQDVALSFEKAEDDIMNEKPRNTKESLFSKDLMLEVCILGISISMVIFLTWKTLIDSKVNITTSRAIIMMLMVFIQNVNVLNCRSEKRTIFKESLIDNPLIIITVLSSIFLQIMMSEISITAAFLKVTPLPLATIFKLLLLSLVIILIFEIYKLIYRSRKEKIKCK